jgi:hypothetical protein
LLFPPFRSHRVLPQSSAKSSLWGPAGRQVLQTSRLGDKNRKD